MFFLEVFVLFLSTATPQGGDHSQQPCSGVTLFTSLAQVLHHREATEACCTVEWYHAILIIPHLLICLMLAQVLHHARCTAV